MRKQQKRDLATLKLRCPEHSLPLVRHEIENPVTGEIEYCWDCPGKMSAAQQERMHKAYPGDEFNDESPCFYHVHEAK